MITVKEAQHIVKSNLVQGTTIKLKLIEALDLFLGEDIYAPINVPSFNQSAMDGYAFKFEDINEEIEIVDEIPAGDIRGIVIKKGQAVRIFTGAMVPDSSDTVVMQELTEVNGNNLLVKDEGLRLGGNIRREGHQIKKGDVALVKGTKITPAAIGFLASLGLIEIEVYSRPKVAVLATGNELVKQGNELKKGQVYESNTLMLQSALNQFGIQPEIVFLPDDIEQTKNAISQALKSSDLILLSGGISVGDYDFVKPSLETNGVEQLFYKVKQKPGKPLFFGKKENKLVFALPGNPAAALNCFYIYVAEVIGAFIGNPSPEIKQTKATILQDYKKKSGRAEFLKAFLNNGTVELLEGQGSDVLKSFAEANCLVFLDDEIDEIQKGSLVSVYSLPI